MGPMTALAASDPGLGGAATFSVLGSASVTNAGISSLSGDVGVSPGTSIADAGTLTVGGTTHNNDSTAITAHANAGTADGNILSQGSTASIGPALDGLTLTTGVYDIGAGRLNGGILHLNGPGVYIFRASSDFISSGSIDLQNGARACDVFWDVQTLATINGSSFVGTILAGSGVHFDTSGTTLNGRALVFGGTGDVTMIHNTITGPTCTTPVQAGPGTGNINVVKIVINDNGGTKKVSDFPLFVDGGPVASGATTNFPTTGRIFNISETSNANYTATFSGDCTSDGHLNLNPGDNKFCVITNNDIGAPVVVPPVPPLIDVVKVPSPLALPNGPGSVLYTYTLKNIGTVPVTNVTMVGDSCSPIVLSSGDVNGDTKLDLNETWVYTCTTNLTETHTNNVVATGWANGLSATDIASATVIVGVPIIPPLIHVTKVPSPLALKAGGGLVTYTEKVTNPGTVPLSNVTLTDDKCAPMKMISGDTNKNNQLDPTETWTYTCQSKLAQTTTNTAVATGWANGLSVRDFAIATVVVAAAVPKLPNTGIFSEANTPLTLAVLFSVAMVGILLYAIRQKNA
ncbi:MAG: ice-binding family protein [Candidatus Uhrbacteria bacterium]|nr:ice-binding family protein [Candidatus Uhrbacteria bacterium]